MDLFCAICMVNGPKKALVELRYKRRCQFQSLISSYINAECLRGCRLLLCVDCNRLFSAMCKFQHTVLRGVMHLIAMQRQNETECHSLPDYINCQSDLVLPVVREEVVSKTDTFQAEDPGGKPAIHKAEPFSEYKEIIGNEFPVLTSSEPKSIKTLPENIIKNKGRREPENSKNPATVKNEHTSRTSKSVNPPSLSLGSASDKDGYSLFGDSRPKVESDSSATVSCESDFDDPDSVPGYERLVAETWRHDHIYADVNYSYVVEALRPENKDQRVYSNMRKAKKTTLNRLLYDAIKLALQSRSISDDFDITQYEPESSESALDYSDYDSGRTLSCESDYEDGDGFPNLAFAKAFSGVSEATVNGRSEDLKNKLHVVTNPPSEWPCAGARCHWAGRGDSASSGAGAGNDDDRSSTESWSGTEQKHDRKLRRKASGSPEPPPRCAACGLSFRTLAQRQSHLATARHLAKSRWRFQCEHCKKRFINKKQTAEHVETEHVAKEANKCPMCGAKFLSARALQRHARAHVLPPALGEHGHVLDGHRHVLDEHGHAPDEHAHAHETLDASRRASGEDGLANGLVLRRPRKQSLGTRNARTRTQSPVNPRKRTQNPGNPRKRTQNPGRTRKRKRNTVNPRKRKQNPVNGRNLTQNPGTSRNRTQDAGTPRNLTQNPGTSRNRTQDTGIPRNLTQNPGTPRQRTQTPGTPRKRRKNPSPLKRTQHTNYLHAQPQYPSASCETDVNLYNHRYTYGRQGPVVVNWLQWHLERNLWTKGAGVNCLYRN